MTDAEIERAHEIADRDPPPMTWAEELERAREIVREVGDLPESLAYAMVMRSGDTADPLGDIDRVRPVGAPDYPPTERI